MAISNTSFDPQAFKAAVREQWDRSAAGWNDHTAAIRAWLREPTEAMLRMAGIAPGQRVLDVAAGAGDQTLDLARRVGPGGAVLATDISPGILALAEENARRAGFVQVQTWVADGERLPVPDGSFDATVCRLGLMFFPDPLQGLREMRRALRPGASACVMVFSGPQANPCLRLVLSTALRHAGLPAPDPQQPGGLMSLGRPGQLEQLFRDAGFREVVGTRQDAPFHLPSAAHYVDFLRRSASPVQQILARLTPEAEAAAWDEIEQRLRAFAKPEGWCGPNELLLAAGRR